MNIPHPRTRTVGGSATKVFAKTDRSCPSVSLETQRAAQTRAPFSVPSYLIKKIKNFKKTVDISGICAILFSVMRNMTFDDLSCEEVFELNAVCDEWQNDAIEAQDADDEWVKSIWGCGVLFKKSEWERQSS